MEDKLPKIAYLFGAGASALKLPTIKGLPERIKVVKEFINENYLYTEEDILTVRDISFQALDAKKFILEGFDKLYNSSINHSTVDTYAKKLNLTNRHSELDELTFILAIYFNIEQKIVGVDPRYNTFLISILDSSAYEFPSNLKFLSWNYDLQFELAYYHLLERDGNLNYELFNTKIRNQSKESFTSIKLNGSCNVVDFSFKSYYNMVSNIAIKDNDPSDLKWALEYGYYKLKNRRSGYDCRVNINFAWYNDNGTEIVDLHSETEILVVIGYSFPFFNRDVDRRIIQDMVKLRKIYVQDLYPENIVSRFLSILPDWKKRGIEIITVNAVDEFFLPPEL